MAGRKLDDYKPNKFYADNTTAKQAGFSKFEVDGEHFFCRYVDGDIALISQAYSGKAGRDNGIESVKKNEKVSSRYAFEDRAGGKFGFALKAGNGQEIAVSSNFETAAAAQRASGRLTGKIKSKSKRTAKIPAAKAAPKKRVAKKSAAKKVAVKKPAVRKSAAKKPATKTAAKPRAASTEQNYMPVAFYRKNSKAKSKGFDSFKGDDGEHYFTYFENGKVALISEGYPTAAIRDKGLASVQKNMKIEKRYAYGKGADGKAGFILKAGNHKEIARSVGYGSAAAATAGAAYIIGTRRRVAKAATTSKPRTKKTVSKTRKAAPLAAAAAVAGASAASAKPAPKKTVKKKTVTKKAVTKKVAAKKTPPKQKTRVAKVTKSKTAKAAPLAAVAVTGAAAAAASGKSKPKGKIRVTKVGSAKPAASASKPKGTVPVKAAAIVAAPLAAAALAATAVTAKPMPEPVAAAPVTTAKPVVTASAAAAPVAAAIPAAAAPAGGGIWGWLKWLLLGLIGLLAMLFLFKACAGGDEDVKAAVTPTKIEMEASTATPKPNKVDLKAAADARASEMKKATEMKAAEVKAATEAKAAEAKAAADAKAAEAKAATMRAAEAMKAKAAAKAKAAQAALTPAPSGKMTAPSISGRICGPSSNVLFNVSGVEAVNVTRLGTNVQFGNSLSLTPDGFYRKLKAAYDTDREDRLFLDLVARSLGHGSFNNMDASMFSNDTLPQGTTGLLGFGTDHALQYSSMNMSDPEHLEAFKVRSVNGTDVHFMKRCGNYMYVCQP